ncbi:MAG: Re/Si-specific NAD(P)(+) transhydrogenase subunit alpha [Balneolaceae bacterium]|nr:MAG: Re/Si-specific NAD(P)(+) transhydrogenase subunit alpha [Balneolaceae bacterium]
MTIGVIKENQSGENRVALSPESTGKLVQQGHMVLVEKDAGKSAHFTDEAYTNAGGTIIATAEEVLGASGIIVKIQPPVPAEVAAMKEGTVLIGFLWALQNRELVDLLNKHKITALGMEALPRISRAQKMDALSAMSNIAGYKAILIGASLLGKYMPMLMTAAGTVAPSKVLVLGAGVAGLQAIATAKRLGAVVEAFDVRSVVKEQIESLGAKFLEVELEKEDTETAGGYAKELSEENKRRQQQAVHERSKVMDMIVTTALIPGRPAPKLITKAMVADMQPGTVIVDLAAEQGGNCELTKPGETYTTTNGVIIAGPLNIPASMPYHASQLYSRTALALLLHILKDGQLNLDFDDEITGHTTITHNGELVSPLMKGA